MSRERSFESVRTRIAILGAIALLVGLACQLFFIERAQAAPPGFDANPVSHSFAETDAHPAAFPLYETLLLEFQNNSAGPVQNGTGYLSGANPGQFEVISNGCNLLLLNVGESCTVQVRFTPTSIGQKLANFVLDTDGGPSIVPLDGEGVSGSVVGSPPIDLGDLPQSIDHPYSGTAYIQSVLKAISTEISTITLEGPDAAAFTIDPNGCAPMLLQPFSSCYFSVLLIPSDQTLGLKEAEIVITTDGDPTELRIPVRALISEPPALETTPAELDFGSVAIGEQSEPQTVTFTNVGGGQLYLEQWYVVGGTSQYFKEISNTCALSTATSGLSTGESCSVTYVFAPGTRGVGNNSASGLVVTNALRAKEGALVPYHLYGYGTSTVAGGVALLEGPPESRKTLRCVPDGFPGSSRHSVTWQRNGVDIPGATWRRYELTDGDIDKQITCSLKVNSPEGPMEAISNQSGLIMPADLSGLEGSRVNPQLCQRVTGPKKRGGYRFKRTGPVQATRPLVIRGKGKFKVYAGETLLGSGKRVVRIGPRSLAAMSPGLASLSVVKKGRTPVLADMAVTPCDLAAALKTKKKPSLTVSTRIGATSFGVKLKGKLRFKPKAKGGIIRISSLDQPTQVYKLKKKRTKINGVTVVFKKKRVKVSGLPANAGVVRINFPKKKLKGKRGKAVVRAKLVYRGQARTLKVRGQR